MCHYKTGAAAGGGERRGGEIVTRKSDETQIISFPLLLLQFPALFSIMFRTIPNSKEHFTFRHVPILLFSLTVTVFTGDKAEAISQKT